MLARLRPDGTALRDQHGRWALLRGINLGGDSKVPYPDGGTHLPSDFSDHRRVSFVGRPFPLDQADAHLDRLRRWGFNCVRLLCTWEAVEHAGLGRLDEAFLDHFAAVSARAGDHGLYVIVDLHQDAWSRMTGGDGAPGWVLEAVGLDPAVLDAADLAITMQRRYDYGDPRPLQPERYPRMCWLQNYTQPANAILWTLFFGGRDFAPELKLGGANVQDALQGRYLASLRAVAERLRDQPHVLGFGSLNEPSRGWIGVALSDRRDGPRARPRPGLAWSPLDGLSACAGHSVTLPWLEISLLRRRLVAARQVQANPRGLRAWLPDRAPPFSQAWEIDAAGVPRARREDFFQRVGDRQVDFERDYLVPFFERVAAEVHAVRRDWAVFCEKDAHDAMADPGYPVALPAQAVNAGHWYDMWTLLSKRFDGLWSVDTETALPAVGAAGILAMYRRKLERLKLAGQRAGVPTLIGEFGVPMDLRGGAAYRDWRRGARGPRLWRSQALALELMYQALDQAQLSAALWNYTASNRNDPRIGDGWNQEDLSVFSLDQRDDPADPDSGGRALEGFVRPYPRFVQGWPERFSFSRRRGLFTLRYDADPAVLAPTEIFVPRLQYPHGVLVEAPGQEVEVRAEEQIVRLRARAPGKAEVRLRRRRPDG